MADEMKVWIDQTICTGDGICEEIAPDHFFMGDDGLAYVKDKGEKADGKNPRLQGGTGLAIIDAALLDAVIDAAEECPGSCIFLETCGENE